ncbi:MAG: hypothetical protein ACUVQ0_01605 [Thermoproteota archaeon]
MESRSFRRFLERKSAKTKVERYGGRISWEEELRRDKYSFAGFLEFVYSDRKTGDYIYLDRSTAFDVLERMDWMERKIKSLSRKLRILLILLIVVCLAAVGGWLT